MILSRISIYVVDNMGDPYPGETGIYAMEDEVILIRDQHYTRDNSGSRYLCCGG